MIATETYAQQHGKQPFDWNAALSDPPDEYDWTKLDHLYNLAADWVTCACGNQCAVLPRDWNGCPRDLMLAHLGDEFMHCISDRDWPQARTTLARIEARSAELLALLP